MKSLFASKVFWVAVATALVGVVGVFSNTYPEISWLVIAKAILDVVLRTQTTMPVEIAGQRLG
jgi:hypothetical protein